MQQHLLKLLLALSAEEEDWRERSQDHRATVRTLKSEIKAVTRQLKEATQHGGVKA